jgi:F-type H+-transporting ATPase subunit b
MEGGVVSVNGWLFVQVVNFLVFTFLINKFLFKPLLQLMEEREKELDRITSEARQIREKADELLAEASALLNAARGRAKIIVEEAVKEARREREKIIKDAMRQAEIKVQKTREELKKVVEAEKKKIAENIEVISKAIVDKILRAA